jgi:hypothetical protein
MQCFSQKKPNQANTKECARGRLRVYPGKCPKLAPRTFISGAIFICCQRVRNQIVACGLPAPIGL